jgi:hypothetical protein
MPTMSISADDAARVERIQSAIRDADAALRRAHPWLRHQDAIGLAMLVGSIAAMLGCGYAWFIGVMPAWICIPAVAFFASLTHELEHDLIHHLYFRRRPWANHAMLALAWLARPTTINPWLRRALHFNHHKHSGTEPDVEERAITNGERWGAARFFMAGDAIASVLVRAWRMRERRRRILVRAAAAYFPLGWIAWGLWWGFLFQAAALGVAQAFDVALPWADAVAAWWPWHCALVVTWIAPNVLRSFCLHLVSSNMHYYGDVEPGNLMQQCQVLTPWWLAPAQAFCCNFGGTHAIHHFVVGQPFYVRQWIAPRVVPVMLAEGVRKNDVASLGRANRWASATTA